MTESRTQSADARARRNVAVLCFAQAVLGAQLPIHIVLGGLSGALLAPSRALATLPISVTVLASMFTAPAASMLMGRFGRRAGFLIGALAGAAGGACAAFALVIGSFPLLLGGAALIGAYQGFQGFFRFAAADTASDAFKPKAISWVLAGGLASAIIGPELIRQTGGMLAPTPYAGAYVAAVGLNLIGAAGLMFLSIPRPPRPVPGETRGRPLTLILREPRVIVAMLCAMIAYALMNLVMTSTPLAMTDLGYSADDAADVVRWHVVAMFAPSFVTGTLIARLGHGRIIAAGLLLLGSCGLIASSGIDPAHFYFGLIALGIGWNFAFIGATSLLATTHAPGEQARVQGLNDFLVFGLVAVASFASGALLNYAGWSSVQLAMVPALTLAALALAWLAWFERGMAPIRRGEALD